MSDIYTIIKGDDTYFNGKDSLPSIKIITTLDLTGWRAKFTYQKTLPLYVKGWSTRKGNQGRGIEFELPCAWDNIPNLFPVKPDVSTLGNKNKKWNNVFANKINVGGVELDGEKLQKLLALLT